MQVQPGCVGRLPVCIAYTVCGDTGCCSPSSKTREAQMKQCAFQCCSISAALSPLLTLPVDALGRTRGCPAAGRSKHNLTLPLPLIPHSHPTQTLTHIPHFYHHPPHYLTTYTLLLTLTPNSLPHTPTHSPTLPLPLTWSIPQSTYPSWPSG